MSLPVFMMDYKDRTKFKYPLWSNPSLVKRKPVKIGRKCIVIKQKNSGLFCYFTKINDANNDRLGYVKDGDFPLVFMNVKTGKKYRLGGLWNN